MEHQQHRESAKSEYRVESPAEENATLLSTPVQDAIEDYLDKVWAATAYILPYTERQERRAEMRMHLEAMTAAYIELDVAPEEAVAAALRQFGDCRKISRQLVREWEQAALSAPIRSARPATRWALRRFGAGALTSAVAIPLLTSIHIHHYIRGWSTPIDMLQLGLFFGLPLLIGLHTGVQVRSRPVLGALRAQLLIYPFMPLVMSGVATNLNMGNIPFREILIWSFGYTAMLAPLGCLGAFAGSWIRRFIRRGPQIAR